MQAAAPHGHGNQFWRQVTWETLPKTAEFDMFETKILHKTILYFNFVILPTVNFKN